MTAPARDVRADATRALTRRLAHEPGVTNAELLARELLTLLDSHQIGLTDRRPPSNPDTILRPPGTGVPVTADTDGIAQYRAARAAQTHKDNP